jgi:small subunit ribosomal protein S1
MTDIKEQAFARFVGSYTPNSVLSGHVTKVVPFGAFVKVAEGVEGLLAGERPEEGAAVEVRIMEVDLDRMRMSLKLA